MWAVQRWLERRLYVHGEEPVDRTRKMLVVPLFCIGGILLVLGVIARVRSLYDSDHATRVRWLACCVSGIVILPVGLYIFCTRRVSRELCEIPVMIGSACVIAYDAALAHKTVSTVAFLNVVNLDCMLVCGCHESLAKVVVVATTVWLLMRAFMNHSGFAEECGAERDRPLLHPDVVSGAVIDFLLQGTVFVIDFHFTRGFATAMRVQTGLVEASVRVSEAAAVLLSRYETEATRELLEGADGERLPLLLRDALQQLVGNLAMYRPYLPQSCLPVGNDCEDSASADLAETYCATPRTGRAASTKSRTSTGADRSLARVAAADLYPSDCERRKSDASSSLQSAAASGISRGGIVARAPFPSREATTRRATLLAVNSKSFLRSCGSGEQAAPLVRGGVGEFVGVVAAESGLVDLVSGDHLFANFNGSRTCFSHRVCAARAAWSMSGAGKEATPPRTAAVCSGSLLCGDFGTSEMRRFMLLGPTYSRLQCLERVAAQLGAVMIDEAVGADADVASTFFTAVAERLRFPKCGEKPFLIWTLAGARAQAGGPDEWMYELEHLQQQNPYEEWNQKVSGWLRFGAPVLAAELAAIRKPFSVEPLSVEREQSELREAGVVGATVVFKTGCCRE